MEILFFAVLMVYFAAMILQFAGVGMKNDPLLKIARAVFAAALVMHTAFSVWRGIVAGRIPLANQFEFASGFSWAAAVLAFALFKKMKYDWVFTASMPVSFLMLSYAAFQKREITELMPALRSTWFALHIGSAVFSYASFAISAGLAVRYLVMKKKTTGQGVQDDSGAQGGRGDSDDRDNRGIHDCHSNSNAQRIPGGHSSPDDLRLKQIDYMSYRMICFGFLLLTVVIFSGAIWAEQAWSAWWSWDPKETWALITWIVYSIYLHQRLRKKWQGTRMAWFSIVALVFVLFTFAGVNVLLPGLHSYAT